MILNGVVPHKEASPATLSIIQWRFDPEIKSSIEAGGDIPDVDHLERELGGEEVKSGDSPTPTPWLSD